MATIAAFKDFRIKSGDWTTVPSKESICAISGSSGYGSVYFGVDIWVGLALLDDGRLYFGFRSGSIGTNNPSVIHGNNWKAWMCHYAHAFRYETGDWPANVKSFSMGTFVGQTGNIDLDIPSSAYANSLTVGNDSSTMSHWHYAGKLAADPDDEEYFERDDENLYYHLAIPVNNSGGNVNDTRVKSTRITFNWPEIFDYYPWARYISDSSHEADFYSHNRKSPEAGSLMRFNGTMWTKCKNKMPENQANSADTTFRYGTSWTKSPKLGKNK